MGVVAGVGTVVAVCRATRAAWLSSIRRRGRPGRRDAPPPRAPSRPLLEPLFRLSSYHRSARTSARSSCCWCRARTAGSPQTPRSRARARGTSPCPRRTRGTPSRRAGPGTACRGGRGTRGRRPGKGREEGGGSARVFSAKAPPAVAERVGACRGSPLPPPRRGQDRRRRGAGQNGAKPQPPFPPPLSLLLLPWAYTQSRTRRTPPPPCRRP